MREKVTGHLYLIPVPIDQNDNTSILLSKDKNIVEHLNYFVVENEKTARFHLGALNLHKPINQLHFEVIDQTKTQEDITSYLTPLLEGFDIGLLSESGCPAIADPGSKMVALAHQKNIRVIPMTGPSSIILALMASGLNGQQFKFHGYLPLEKEDRIKKIIAIENESSKYHETQIFIETPYRNQHIFNDLISKLQDKTKLCIALDMSSENEFILTKKIADWKKEVTPDLKNKPCVFLLQG
ncbi:Uroporphyrin-III C/tetrapyrrole (Corrin/Porphyrin) methyltransferase [Candidatus Methylopumilus planktonicus]|uniref:Uroporphyrin-III C/tetrapyrrole (Corrin/Porphyrin) methyltransferase n=1 Tax=Candidatus Methylopumilus planktonicus TaxID=1581557 RepID=A0A0D6EW40_9PROT|nr:SAM-dependent methyltransferase [Candidatus Methylopumilus planktonicus]CEZ19664.1 Uroporphyrin-III C/tetrapyrrole (Corrin/Porphyrin) methyltransferase [Candidatus Methylopumilus planktonicus]